LAQTSHESVSLEILLCSLGEEDICFIQKENASPAAGERKIGFQGGFNLLGRCPEIP
jgi:hypothetical protein